MTVDDTQMNIDLLILAQWVITADHHNKIFSQHAVAVDKGNIIAILPHNDALRQYKATQLINLPEHAICPGFINAHTHSAMALLKGLADDLPLMEWLQNHI
jgi:5-methylthioadenosine/S-adenosylhomocysteine deaminase